jgi:hypothetical protein
MTEQKPQEQNTNEEKSITPASNNTQGGGELKGVWHVPFSYIASLRNDERIRFVTALTIAFLVLLGSVVVTLLILVQFFDIGIDKDGAFFRAKSPVAKPPPTPDNAPKIEPSGKLTSETIQSFKKEASDGDVFRRNWIGPDGEEISSNDLDPCLLMSAPLGQPRWGQLLAQVMAHEPGLARSDPFRALADNGLKPKDLRFVSERNLTTLEATRDGFLTFIINEAIFADPSSYKSESYPQPEYCKRGYEALLAASEDLKGQDQKDYVIHPGSIPLVWYADNVGSFQVIVRRETKEFIARVVVESTSGFQNSGIYLKRGEKVILEPDGRVHLALRQIHTFAGAVRPILEREKARKRGG